MYGILDFMLLFILLVEIFVSFHRKSALTELTGAISKLTIKSEQEADFIQGIANYSLSPKKTVCVYVGVFVDVTKGCLQNEQAQTQREKTFRCGT